MYWGIQLKIYLSLLFADYYFYTVYMHLNPFYLNWNKGWQFTLFLEGGKQIIEAKGFGIIIRGEMVFGDSPKESADKLILSEERRRKSIYYSWKKSL